LALVKKALNLLSSIEIKIFICSIGVFAAPEEILKLTKNPSLTLITWLVYGIIAFIAALCYVELGCTFLVSGGSYA
jgi:amino acid transporter